MCRKNKKTPSIVDFLSSLNLTNLKLAATLSKIPNKKDQEKNNHTISFETKKIKGTRNVNKNCCKNFLFLLYVPKFLYQLKIDQWKKEFECLGFIFSFIKRFVKIQSFFLYWKYYCEKSLISTVLINFIYINIIINTN